MFYVTLRHFFHLWDDRSYCIYFNFTNELWMHASGREKTNHSAAISDLITETTISACDNLMTVHHPRHIKNTTFNHRKLLWTSMAQDGTIVLMRIKRWVPQQLHSASLTFTAALLFGSFCPGFCFCPSHSNVTLLYLFFLLFITAHNWLSFCCPISPCFSLFSMNSAMFSLQREFLIY